MFVTELYGPAAWPGRHELWLREQQFDRAGMQLAFRLDFQAMLLTWLVSLIGLAVMPLGVAADRSETV